MEKACGEGILEASSMGVFEIQGEPAVVINGVPDVPPVVSPENACSRSALKNVGFGEWFVGREVRKWFEGKFYGGVVVDFDRETCWFRVVYEDGDLEDLEWHELEDVLLPLDIGIPLKMLALKMINKSQSPVAVHGAATAPAAIAVIAASRDCQS